MAVLELSSLVIDNSQERAMDLLRALQPEIQFTASDFTVSLRKGALSHAEEKFAVCFISESFGREDLASFFRDMEQMGSKETCLFIRVDDSIPDGFDRASLQADGFATVISRKGTFDDKQAVDQALQNRFFVKEEKKKKMDVDSMMEMLLKEIDRTASDIRRGHDRKLVAIPMDGIELDVQFSEEVLKSYFESLEKRTENAAPRTVDRLNVPDSVLTRALPELTKDGYKGASHRVWELLAQKYGVKIGEQPKAHTEPRAEGPRSQLDPVPDLASVVEAQPAPEVEAAPAPADLEASDTKS